jgi:hypothetical protein
MKYSRNPFWIFLALCAGMAGVAWAVEPTAEKGPCRIRLDTGHPWRPPFGLARIGQPLTAVVEITTDRQPPAEYVLVGLAQGKEVVHSTLSLTGKSPYTCRAKLNPWPTELVLLVKADEGLTREVARLAVTLPEFEADAVARPDRMINPVDLGTILPPSDWLLLTDGQKGTIDLAAICRTEDISQVRATAWFDSARATTMTATATLTKDKRLQFSLPLPPSPAAVDHDILHVTIESASNHQLWHKKIETMIVSHPPRLPTFGAIETRLRYDAPISVLSREGKLSSMSYATAWDPKLRDVVVALPNGSRFVFWRGSCYIPFWASRHNVGFCYEWAEGEPAADAMDCVEPLMDKELRYGRVRVIESTPARVHVRWSYQSCDFNYKVWGDSAVEDYYFYPDGFGTRVLTLQSDPKTANYELSEFIVLTPQSTYPLSIFPAHMMDVLFLDGQKREFQFPYLSSEQGEKAKSRNMPAIFRVQLHKDEPQAAIYFNPLDRNLPPHVYAPFLDHGQLVTSFYWGSHWPLARGKTTGYAIDERVALTPCHNSIVSWAKSRPMPLRMAQYQTVDTLGRSKPMQVQTWAWLIGMSDADDTRLLHWARSFSTPPSIEVQGARLDGEPYLPERRAIRLIVEDTKISIMIKPATPCIHPVFELAGAPRNLHRVWLADRPLDAKEYAWGGHTLWLGAVVAEATRLKLEFAP